MIRFTVPGDPKPKERPRVNPGRPAYTPRATHDAEARVRGAALVAGARPLTGPVTMRLRFYRDNARRVDLDNLVKLVQDALNGACYRDDSQIVRVEAEKHLDREHPRTEVEIAEADAAPQWHVTERTVVTATEIREGRRATKQRLTPSVRRHT